MFKTNYLFRAFLVAIVLFVFSCQKNENKEVVFQKEVPVNEDATKVWLRSNDSYQNSKHYFTVFYKYYNNKIKEKKYLEAAEILDVISTKLVFFYDFNKPFLTTIKTFDSCYRNKVPVLKTTFIENYYANYYYDKGNFKKSCDCFKKITLLEPNDYKSCKKIARANYELAYVYYGMGRQNLSLQANHRALKYYTKINDLEGLGSVYSNYTDIYRTMHDKRKAIEYSNAAIKCFVKSKNTYDTYMSLYNKICTYDDFSDVKTAMLIDSVLKAFNKSKFDSAVLKIAFSDFKVLYLLREEKFDVARKILDSVQPLVKKVNSTNWTQDYEVTLAEYVAVTSPKNADINNIKRAIPLLKTNKQYEKLSLFYSVLKKQAVHNNDFKNALAYEEELSNVKDSIGNQQMINKTAELEAKYQIEKKEQQIAIDKKTIVNKNTTIALLASLFVGFVLVLIIYLIGQKQKKLHLEKQNTQLYTKQLLEKTEEERKRIASDLHDSVSHELLSLKNSLEEKTQATNQKIDEIINDIRSISRNLHPIMFDKIGLKESINQMVERAESVNNFMVTAEINYEKVLSSSDELQIYRIVQEALSNIIKYADAIAAKISITENENNIIIEIKDNGKGFNVEETLNSKSSFGLHNIIERSRAIGGHANIISNVKGTIITIEIKKA